MSWRVQSVGVALVAGMAILGLRLWDLQIVHWSDYVHEAECNRLHPERLKAPRGMIYGPDESVVLADNRPACDLVMVPAECQTAEIESVCGRLQELLGVDANLLIESIQKTARQPYRQITVKQDVTKTELTRVEEFSYALPGVFTVVRPQRRYLYGKTGGQLLGYLGRINQTELDALDAYEGDDLIGRSGLEQTYEEQMRGVDGQLVVNVYVEDRRPQLRTDEFGRPYIGVDSYGHQLAEETEFRKDPQPGRPLFTTLDIDLQRHCEQLLEGEIGAIAVLNAETGAVLTLASTPGYDPSVFVTYGRDRERSEALSARPNPMRNRCFQEMYAPGSVFKVMLATAALEEGVIDEKTTFFCPGHFQINGAGRAWHCWRRSGHGSVSVVDALAFSCDVFFYNVGLRLGIDKISEWSKRMGLNAKTGIDLPQEVEGLIPSQAWKEELLRPLHPQEPWAWKWYPGDTVNVAIGQGEAATTPLQNAVMMAVIVNGGYRVRPYLNRDIGPALSERVVSEKTIEIVRAGMRKCVEKGPPAPSGTGHAAHIPDMTVIGKTGSAQIVGLEQHEDYESEKDIPYALRDHAWFVSGVLDRDPRIAICVLVEHGHHGSSAAAPLAKRVIEYFYSSRAVPSLKLAKEGGPS